MSAKLSATNPYLRDPAARQRSVVESVATSSAIEGIRAPFKKKPVAVSRVVKKTNKRAVTAKSP